MKIAAAYIRVSTEGQDEYSPDSQIKLCKDYAEKNGYLLPEQYIFYDDGISAKTAKKRIQFNRMIALAKDKSRPFSAILVWKYSRFARNQEESIVYKSLLKKNGVSVISISEQIDNENPFGSLIERIIEWMDEYYLVRLSGEVKRGMLEKFSRGQIVNGPPLGYAVKEGKYVPDQNAELIKLIYNDFLCGASYSRIARKLNDSGEKTARGNYFERRTIEYIIRNPVYAGKLRRNSVLKDSLSNSHVEKAIKIVDGEHEPLIPPEMWKQAQIRAEKLAERYGKYSRTEVRNEFMLRGLLRCSSCGSVMVNSNKGYQCNKYSRGLCRVSHYISKQKINAAVIDGIIRSLGDLDINIEINPAVIYSEKRKPKSMEHEKTFFGLINGNNVNEAVINTAFREFIDKIIFYRDSDCVTIFIYA